MRRALEDQPHHGSAAEGRVAADFRRRAVDLARRIARHIEGIEGLDAATDRADDVLANYDFLLQQGLNAPENLSDRENLHTRITLTMSLTASRDRTAWLSLAGLAVHFLQEGHPLPAHIRDFVIEVLERRCPCPKVRGRPAHAELRRRLICVMIAYIAETFQLRPTRNDISTHRDSACDIAAEAMASLGLTPSTYSGLKRIWQKRDPDLL
ncbi:MAG: hypothetical protein ACK40I_01955 [Tabrizicola sp.]